MIRLRLLGTPDLRDPAGREFGPLLSQPKRLGLLAYLAVARPRGYHRRDTLLGLFWPDHSQKQARGALNQAVYYIRRVLGPDILESRGADELRLAPGAVWCDVVAFEEALERDALEDALEIYPSDLLEGFFVSDAVEFERWLELERAALRDRARDAAWTLSERAEDRGVVEAAMHWTRRALALAPTDERAIRKLIELLDRAGQRAQALREYEAFARRLREEAGVEPSPETQATAERVRGRTEVLDVEPDAERPVGPAERPATAAPMGEPLAVAGRQAAAEAPAARPAAAGRHAPRSVGGRRRRILLLLLLSAVPVAGLLTLRAVGGRPTAPATPAPEGGLVAVFPFTYLGAAAYEYTGHGVPRLLGATIDGAPDLAAVDALALGLRLRSASEAAVTRDSATAIARDFGARFFILGSVTGAANRIRVHASLYDRDAPGAPLASATEEGTAHQLFEMADALTASLLGPVEATHAHALGSGVLTTRSTAAFQAYIAGERHYLAGRYTDAVAALQRAVQEDTAFALAHLRLATAANWIGQPAMAYGAIAQAVRHAGRLPATQRRQIEAFHLALSGRAEEAERHYRALIAEQPADVESWAQLAELMYHWGPTVGRPVSETRTAWERVLALDPWNARPLVHLIRVAARERDRTEFDSLAGRLARMAPDPDRELEVRLLRGFVFEDSAARAAAVREFHTRDVAIRNQLSRVVLTSRVPLGAAADALLGPDTRRTEASILHALVAVATGRIRAAGRIIETAAIPAHRRAQYMALIATLDHVPGSAAARERARRMLRATSGSARASATAAGQHEYLLGMLAVRAGQDSVADRYAARLLDPLPPSAVSAADSAAEDLRIATATRHGRLLRAELLRRRGQVGQALELLGEPRLWPIHNLLNLYEFATAHERWLRAELLRALGRDREALRLYATFPDPRAYDLLYLAPAHLRRAELHERLGQADDAADHYARAFDLLQNADPEFEPLRRAARTALERLPRPQVISR